MEAGAENTSTAARTARVIRLPGRAGQDAARGAPGGDGRASGVGEGLALLLAAREAAGGSCSRPVEMRPLARRLGLAPRAVENLAMRLQAERLVRVVSMAEGLMRLTPEGARAAEGAAEDADGSTDGNATTGVPRAGGGSAGPRAGAPAFPVLGRAAVRELEGMLGPLMAGLDRLDLGGAFDGERRSELAAEVRTIEAQLGSPRPKRRIVAAALASIKDAAGSAGTAESGRISRAIDAFTDGAGGTTQETRAGRSARVAARDGAVSTRPGAGPAGEDGSGTRRPEEEGSADAARAPETGGVRVRKRVRDGGAGDQAVRGAAGAPRRAGEAADRATAGGAGAGRRVVRVVDPSGDVVRTTLNGEGEILDEDVVGSVAGPPVGGHLGDGGRRVPAVFPGGGDGHALRSATVPEARRPDGKGPASGGGFGTENRRARTGEHGGDKVGEQTQQQTQEQQYLQQAQDFFAQSMGRIKGQMQSDNAQLQGYMQQLPEESQAQIQEMTDSYDQFEGTIDRVAQDAGVGDALEEAARQARQNADQASGQDPTDQAADQAQQAAGQGMEDGAAGQFAPLADSLPEGYEAVGQPFTDRQGNRNLQGQDGQGNTVVVQRVGDGQGGVVDTIYDRQGGMVDEVVPEDGGGQGQSR